jgi:hypothetical protein
MYIAKARANIPSPKNLSFGMRIQPLPYAVVQYRARKQAMSVENAVSGDERRNISTVNSSKYGKIAVT